MTQRQLEKLKDKWAKRLKLQDWDINIKYNPLLPDAVWGRCGVWATKYIADIEIALPEVIAADAMSDDIETILVHEMLHIIWDIHGIWDKCPDENSAEYRYYEKCIDKMTKVLRGAYSE